MFTNLKRTARTLFLIVTRKKLLAVSMVAAFLGAVSG